MRPLTFWSRSILTLTLLVSLVLTVTGAVAAEISPLPIFEYPYYVKHGNELVDSLIMPNGTGSTITVLEVGKVLQVGPGNWLNIAPTGPFDIPTGTDGKLFLTFNPLGAINTPGTIVNLKGYVYIRTDQPSLNDSLTKDININVADTIVGTRFDTLFTSCTGLVTRNDGNLGNDGDGKVNLDYWYSGDCDTLPEIPGETNVYLFSASPVVIAGASLASITNASWAGFGDTYASAHGLKPVVDMVPPIFTFGSSTGSGYTAQNLGQFVTSDSSIAIERTVYAPTSALNCNFMIVNTRMFPNPAKPGAKANLTVMEMVDWDVPSDSGSYNEVGFDAARQTMYQRGIEFPEKNALECLGGDNDNNRRYAGIRFFKSCLSPGDGTSPELGAFARNINEFRDVSGVLLVDSLWIAGGINIYDTPASPTHADWFSAINIKRGYTLAAADTLVYTYAVASIRSGTQAQFLAITDAAKAWYDANLSGTVGFCFTACPACCAGERGDVFPIGSGDGQVDLSDLQVYIDYLFLSGPSPACLEEFDTFGFDGAIDIADLQAVIEYSFFSANLPACC